MTPNSESARLRLHDAAGEDEESQEDAKQEAITDSQGSEGEKKESA